MDRRRFLQLSAATAAMASTESCTHLTPRYTLPEGLTRPEEGLLLVGASVVDVAAGEVRPGALVLIRDGRIEQVFARHPGEAVAADRVVDLRGAFVMPGLINAHCHMTLTGGLGFGPGYFMAYERQLERNAEECVKHGVTTVRDMLALSDIVDKLRDKIARGEVAGPRILTCCCIEVEDGYGQAMGFLRDERYRQTANGPEEGKEAVRRGVDGGADFIKLFQQPRELLLPGKALPVMDVETMRAIRDQADRLGLYATVHHTEASGLDRALEADVPGLEHMVTDCTVDDGRIRKLVDGGHVVVPTATVAFALAYGRRGDPNWGKGFSVRIAEERARVMPELIEAYCEPELVGSTMRFYRRLCDPDSYERWHLFPWPDPTTMNAAANLGSVNMTRLHEAGVTFGCGNDGGIPLAWPGALALEMVMLEEQGIGTADVLRMATLNNVRLMGLEDEIGTVEPGRVADLVVVDHNPLDTARNLLEPRMVFQAGRMAYRAV